MGRRQKPTPSYPDAATRALGEELESAFARKKELEKAGAPTGEVDRQILEVRRKLREGGQLRVGDLLGSGRYLLLEQVGRGGFAFVWKALDRESDAVVAIKVLHSSLAGDGQRRERFFRGARAMAGLDHAAIVKVLAPAEEDGGFHYFVMEYVEGEDLHRAVTKGRMPKEEVLSVVLHVGDALAAAHDRGLVHRDVKPANILLDGARAPRLTDFDLVGGGDTTGGTRTGAMGTFLYAAPEILNQPQHADARADVYGLAMTAVFGLYGGELSMGVLRNPDAVIDALECEAGVKGVLKRAVDWDREKRFADVRTFCAEIRRIRAVAQEHRTEQESGRCEVPEGERARPEHAREMPSVPGASRSEGTVPPLGLPALTETPSTPIGLASTEFAPPIPATTLLDPSESVEPNERQFPSRASAGRKAKRRRLAKRNDQFRNNNDDAIEAKSEEVSPLTEEQTVMKQAAEMLKQALAEPGASLDDDFRAPTNTEDKKSTRKDPRAKVLSMTVRYKSATVDEFIEHHSHDVSRGGIFIKTPSPFPPGTLLKFEIRIQDEQSVLAGVGRVVWKREASEAAGESPAGMGVKFIKIDDKSKGLISRLVDAQAGRPSAYEAGKPGGADAGEGDAAEPAAAEAKPAPAPEAKPAAAATPKRAGGTMLGLGSIGSIAKGFFPKTEPEKEMPSPEERTVMKQAAEFLKQALAEAGASLDEDFAAPAKTEEKKPEPAKAEEKKPAAEPVKAEEKPAAEPAKAEEPEAKKDEAPAAEEKPAEEPAKAAAAEPEEKAAKSTPPPAAKDDEKKEEEKAKPVEAKAAPKPKPKAEPAEAKPAPKPLLQPAEEPGGSGRMLTILLIAAGLAAAVWLLFGRGGDDKGATGAAPEHATATAPVTPPKPTAIASATAAPTATAAATAAATAKATAAPQPPKPPAATVAPKPPPAPAPAPAQPPADKPKPKPVPKPSDDPYG